VTLTAIEPADWPWFRYGGYSFSLGLTDGSEVWLSGHSASAFDPDSSHIVVRGDMADQVAVAHDKASALLGAAGVGWQDVTHVVDNVAAAGLDAYGQVAEHRRHAGLGELPVTTVVVDRLLRPDALIEIEVDASRGAGAASGAGAPVGDGPASAPVRLPMVYPLDSAG
jgi:enamine deaminase RidA (YjgF/YER057c/UK114 family)